MLSFDSGGIEHMKCNGAVFGQDDPFVVSAVGHGGSVSPGTQRAPIRSALLHNL